VVRSPASDCFRASTISNSSPSLHLRAESFQSMGKEGGIVKTFKNHPDHWQFLHPWFRPIWLKLLIPWFAIIPLLLTILRDVPEVIQVDMAGGFQFDFRLPFKWWLLWGASFAYVLAFAVFAVSCPRFIRQYPTYRQYEAVGHSPRWMAWELNYAIRRKTLSTEAKTDLFKRLVEKKLAIRVATIPDSNPAVSERGTAYYFEFQGQAYEFLGSEIAANASIVDREVFWELLARMASSRTTQRMTIWYLLYAAATLLAIAIGQNIWVVLKYCALELRDFIVKLCGA
jgi:hypothetical protein